MINAFETTNTESSDIEYKTNSEQDDKTNKNDIKESP